MCTPALVFERVTKEYRTGWLSQHSLRAVSDVTLSLGRGQIFGLVGPNRAGKTTLVKLLLSLCRPTAGQIVRLGRPAADLQTLAQIGYVHENQAFPRYLTVPQLLYYYGALSLLPEPLVRQRVPRLLAQVGLADRLREPITNFSKGMIQRLGLAQALLNEPELLVLDEPSEGLDLEGRQILRSVLTEQRQRGRTVLLVSHLLADVEQLCDAIGVLVAGRLVWSGPLQELTGGAAGSLEAALSRLYTQQDGEAALRSSHTQEHRS